MKTNYDTLIELQEKLDEVADRVYFENYSSDLHKRDRRRTSHAIVRAVTTVKRLIHELESFEAWRDKPQIDLEERRKFIDEMNTHRLHERYLRARYER